MAYIGTHSYSVYLWHIPVLLFLNWAGLTHWRGGKLIYFVASLTVGIGMSTLIEFPVLKLRDRLYPRRNKGELSSTLSNENEPTDAESISGSQVGLRLGRY